jgi:hypothetical protein
VYSFSDDKVRLFILNHLQPRAQIPDLLLDRRGLLLISDIQNAMDVEAEC